MKNPSLLIGTTLGAHRVTETSEEDEKRLMDDLFHVAETSPGRYALIPRVDWVERVESVPKVLRMVHAGVESV